MKTTATATAIMVAALVAKLARLDARRRAAQVRVPRAR